MPVKKNGAQRAHLLNTSLSLQLFFQLCLICLHMLQKPSFLHCTLKTLVSYFIQLPVVPNSLFGNIYDQLSVNYNESALF